MLAVAQKLQVFRPIVSLAAVAVMHVLVRQKPSPELAFHDEPVLLHLPPALRGQDAPFDISPTVDPPTLRLGVLAAILFSGAGDGAVCAGRPLG
jgi:hypothetical protein